jgi:acyl-CoA thioester hydrolase
VTAPATTVDLTNGRPADVPAAAAGTGPDADAPRRHVFDCPLRWGDMDAFGHVNNVVYLRYLEQARVDWMFITAKEAGVEQFSLGTVVARHEIDYKAPLVYRAEPVRIETWVTEIRAASFTVAYEVRDDKALYALASTVLVPYDLAHARPRRLSREERDYLELYFAPPQPTRPRPGGAGARA